MRDSRTVVAVGPRAPLDGASVCAVSTESRNLDASAAKNAITLAAANWRAESPMLLFKKLDSTLRGNAGAEITAAIEAFHCDAAIVCPAFPRMNRVVSDGLLRVNGDASFAPIAVAVHLRAQGVGQCVHSARGAIPAAIADAARVIVLDAVCDEDLDRIAAEALALDLRILWAGSAGLAAALARTFPASAPATPHKRVSGAVLFCIGSDHPVTVAQQTALEKRMHLAVVDAEHATPTQIGSILHEGRHVALRIPHGRVPRERVAELTAGAPAAAILLTGGDTASLFCQAACVEGIELTRELLPGIPLGVIRGGAFDGVSVVTKSGGFGEPDALIQIAEYFSCPN